VARAVRGREPAATDDAAAGGAAEALAKAGEEVGLRD